MLNILCVELLILFTKNGNVEYLIFNYEKLYLHECYFTQLF